jgi:hypothetical protein
LLPQHQGTIEAVLTMADNNDYMSHQKFLSHGKFDGTVSTVASQRVTDPKNKVVSLKLSMLDRC